jgi:3-methyl-2-oxobutanoate hydroxymethyltransferase
MVMHGNETTIPATIDIMALHIRAVAKGAVNKFIIGDLPFCSYRKDLNTSMNNVEEIIRAGAQAVKLEGIIGNEQIIDHIVNSGIPVMGHIGLTPQHINQLGTFRVQGKNETLANKLLEQALLLEKLGCFAIVIECVPQKLAQIITQRLSIPTIGIGAGSHTSGQVLVLHDLLGLQENFKPKFVKNYLNGNFLITEALNIYNNEVKNGIFPADEQSYDN